MVQNLHGFCRFSIIKSTKVFPTNSWVMALLEYNIWVVGNGKANMKALPTFQKNPMNHETFVLWNFCRLRVYTMDHINVKEINRY